MPEYSELHIKNNNVKYIDGANPILFVLNIKSLLDADMALVIKHFDGTRWKKQLHKTCDEKQKLTRNDKAAWHEFFQIVKIHVIIQGEVHFVANLSKIYNEIRPERNLSSSTRRIDIRQKL